MAAVVVVEGRDGEQQFRIEGVDPGKIHDRVGFVVGVAQADAVDIAVNVLHESLKYGIVGNLVVILAQRSHEAQLVRGIDVEDQRAEAAVAVGGIVNDLRDRRLDAEIAAVAVDAGVVGEALGVAAEAELVVGLIEISGAEHEFGLAVALESGAGHDVEDAVGAVAEFRAVAAAADFEVVDVFGIELRAEVGGDVGVGDGDAVDEPAGLMSAANVELVVGDVGSGDEVGDHGEAVGASGAGSARDVEAADERGGRGGIGGRGFGRAGDVDGLFGSGDVEREVQHGLRAGDDDDISAGSARIRLRRR